jgi:DNA-binding CsgD family transcriptional regulator
LKQWPILPRSEVATILDRLERRPRKAVLLRGPSGIGKTTVASQVASAAVKDGLTVAPIVALKSLATVPLGALAPLLTSEQFSAHSDIAMRHQAFLALLSSRSNEYLLLVDDAPLLDEVSAAGIYQLVRVLGVRCVLTARDEHPITGPLARLLHEDLVSTIDLDALSFDQSYELVQAHFGTLVQPDSVRALFESSHGNPMFLRELAFAAQRIGAVHSGPHGLEIERTRLPAHTVDGVGDRLKLLSPSAHQLAELMAVSQLWTRELCEPDALDELVTAGIALILSDGFVRLAHPLYTEALIAGMNAGHRRERTAAAAESLGTLHEDPLRYAGIRLSLHASMEQLEWASRYAWSVGDHAAAVTLARSALENGGGFDSALALGSAESALGHPEAATSAFERALMFADNDRDIALAVSRWGQHRAYREHDPVAALALGENRIAELRDPTAVAVLSAEVVKWRLMTGQALSDDAADTPSSDDALDPPGALMQAIGQAMMFTMAGAVDGARLAVQGGRVYAEGLRDVIPHASSLLDLNDFLILVAEGQTAQATHFASERRLEPYTEAAGLWSYALALIHVQRGDGARALELAALAVEQLNWRDFTGLVGPAIALHATTLAQQGRITEARAALDSLAPALLDDPKVVLQRAEALAWILVADGDADAAAEQLCAAGVLGAELGHPFLAAIAASAATRFSRPEVVVDLLERLAAGATSVLMTLFARFARAATESDAAALESVATDLHAAGLGACAVVALGDAISIYDAAGKSDSVRRAALARSTMRASGIETGVVTTNSDLELSRRELEVAELAAQRVRSKQIAERLGLSTRTVDNHLMRIYRKLGISGRDELEAILRSNPQSTGSTS